MPYDAFCPQDDANLISVGPCDGGKGDEASDLGKTGFFGSTRRCVRGKLRVQTDWVSTIDELCFSI